MGEDRGRVEGWRKEGRKEGWKEGRKKGRRKKGWEDKREEERKRELERRQRYSREELENLHSDVDVCVLVDFIISYCGSKGILHWPGSHSKRLLICCKRSY